MRAHGANTRRYGMLVDRKRSYRAWPVSMTTRKQRPRWLPTFLAAMVLLAAGGLEPACGQTPSQIRHPAVDYPIWVSVETAEAKGALESALFHPIAARRIQTIFESTPVHGCYPVGPMIADRYGGRTAPSSLAEASAAYPVRAIGRVIELLPGFLVGEPGTLVIAEVGEESRNVEAGTNFFVFIPIADFDFRGKRVCKRDPRYAGLPKIGDEVLLFAAPPEAVDAQYLSVEYPENLVVVSGAEVLYSPSLTASAKEMEELPTTRGDLLTALRLLASGDGGR
jgi:hypothetical protein